MWEIQVTEITLLKIWFSQNNVKVVIRKKEREKEINNSHLDAVNIKSIATPILQYDGIYRFTFYMYTFFLH